MENLSPIVRAAYLAYLAFANHVVCHIPFKSMRCLLYRRLFLIKIGRGSAIHMGVRIE